MSDIKSIVRIDSDSGRSCPVGGGCKFYFDPQKFEEGVNHMIQAHGYHVEHIGQETSTGKDGRPYQVTVAITVDRR